MRGGKRGGRGVVRAGVSSAVLVLCLGGLLVAPPARAAEGGCGGQLVKTLPFHAGEVRIFKTRTRACAVALARDPGERRPMTVSIQPRGGVPVRDIGRFTRYAGPVTVGAINRCVYVKGSVGVGSAESGWILC
ncbi:hypothetical protein ACFV7Q_08835 [Streptomyces sp. NPDC059851]|uniref:hypothetical protein n=1 Tax=Streptomyces sp. NPDC059851 TaxID=3346971 RepID=UPI00365159C9